jgi:hypothetical protein
LRKLILALVLGAFATFAMDALNRLVATTGLIDPVNHAVIGNILTGWSNGHFVFASPAQIPQHPEARLLGFIYHYLIGITLTGLYLVVTARWQPAVSWRRALAFGLLTSTFSLCLLFPSAGIGFLGLKAPTLRPLTSSLANHLFFGLGIFLGQSVARWRPRTALERQGTEASP